MKISLHIYKYKVFAKWSKRMHFVILIILVISLLNKNEFYIANQESIHANQEGELMKFGTRITCYLVLRSQSCTLHLNSNSQAAFLVKLCINVTNLYRSSSMKKITSFQSICFTVTLQSTN